MKTFADRKSMDKSKLTIGIVALVAVACVGQWTWMTWQKRHHPVFHPTRDHSWKLISGNADRQVHIRVAGSAFWIPAKTQIISSDAHVLTASASTTLRENQSGSEIAISAHAVAYLETQSPPPLEPTLTLLSGVATVRGPVNVMLTSGVRHIDAGDIKTVSVVTSAASIETTIVDTLIPVVGSNIELVKTPTINFEWTQSGSEEAVLEFAHDSSFQTILFAKNVGTKTSTTYDFGDRGHGAWFARIRDRDQTLAVTSFHTYEKLAPERIRRLGRRWLTWEDHGPSSYYRIEISASSTFASIDQSLITRAKFFDLSLATESGTKYLRVVGIDQNEKEHTGESFRIEIPDRNLLMQSRTEFGDPSLALFAKGWRIQLNESEAKRIREGYVILRESELRGIRVSPELDQKIKNQPAKYVFEVAKDLSFSNPERVRPTAQGELLPPALPLGTIYTRIREIEDDGSALGAYGPPSRISTLLPAPKPLPANFIADTAVLKWKYPFEASGFEVQVLSPSGGEPKSYRTQAWSKEIPLPDEEAFEWMVTALDETGRPISAPSSRQVAKKPKSLPKILARDPSLQDQLNAKKAALRELASNNPSLVELDLPAEDAVLVGGATATKYGRLQWRDLFPTAKNTTDKFVVEIATDGDFVNVIERASTSRLHYTLQGDLPEGALFWRVKKRELNVWSISRKFEIVYE